MKDGIKTTKQEVMADANIGEGCLGRAAQDEPVFVIRAHDDQFVDRVSDWIATATSRGVNQAKLDSARAVLEHGIEWQDAHGTKQAD